MPSKYVSGLFVSFSMPLIERRRWFYTSQKTRVITRRSWYSILPRFIEELEKWEALNPIDLLIQDSKIREILSENLELVRCSAPRIPELTMIVARQRYRLALRNVNMLWFLIS
jgi:hypothetical protein